MFASSICITKRQSALVSKKALSRSIEPCCQLRPIIDVLCEVVVGTWLVRPSYHLWALALWSLAWGIDFMFNSKMHHCVVWYGLYSMGTDKVQYAMDNWKTYIFTLTGVRWRIYRPWMYFTVFGTNWDWTRIMMHWCAAKSQLQYSTRSVSIHTWYVNITTRM